MKTHTLIATLMLSTIATPAMAQHVPIEMCETEATTGWSFYCDPEPEVEEEPTPVPAPAKAIEEPPSEFPATEEMMAFRKRVDELKYKAVLDPTPENVLAYMEVNKSMADQASYFADQWQRVLYETPRLDANAEYPLTAAGIGVFQDQRNHRRVETFKAISATHGLMFVFEDETVCGLCKVQGEILQRMEQQYGVSILAVSKDGGLNTSFPGAVPAGDRLRQLGLDDNPSPLLALVDPIQGSVMTLGAGLLAEDQILDRIDILVNVPVGERY